MKTVIWTDARGFKHRSLVRNGDPDTAAPMGLRQDPPDLHQLDWDEIARDMHNAFVELGVVTWADLQRPGVDLRRVILGATQRRIQSLFRDREVEDND